MEFERVRPFFVTKKGFRNHKQHKEWELKTRLQEGRSSERTMASRVAAALDMPYLRDLRACKEVPYVYGIDITSTACIKHQYSVESDKQSAYSIAELDIESDVVYGTDKPTIATLFMPPVHGRPALCYTWITKEYAQRTNGFLEKLEKATQDILVDYIEDYRSAPKKYTCSSYPIVYKSAIVADDMALWKEVMTTAHTYQPDFLSIWNMEYEMGKLVESCERYGVDPASFLSDPRVPEQYRYFKYVVGEPQKVTAAGKVMPISPAARWHYVDTPASFYIVDQMCVYKQTRMGQQEEQSYSLDAIMKKEIGITKLKYAAADHLPSNTIDWHEFMQKHHPVEYAVYNRFDCIGPAFIDEKVKDLSFVMASMAASSDFKRFPSQPRRTCDALHWYVQDLPEQRVMGVTASALTDEYDEDTLSRLNWILKSVKKGCFAINGK